MIIKFVVAIFFSVSFFAGNHCYFNTGYGGRAALKIGCNNSGNSREICQTFKYKKISNLPENIPKNYMKTEKFNHRIFLQKILRFV